MNNFKIYIDNFQNSLKNIEDYIFCLEIEKKAINEMLSMDNISVSNAKDYSEKISKANISGIQYNAVIISLYGIFEEFIDNLFGEYLKQISKKVKQYNDLPEKIRKKHMFKTADYLSNPQRYLNCGITPEDAISNLYQSINNLKNSVLNQKLLLSHSANLNAKHVFEFINDLGDTNFQAKIIKNHNFLNFFKNKLGIEEEEAKKRIETFKNDNDFLFSELNKLVEERNNVAHGTTENRISYLHIKEKIIPFFYSFSNALEETIIENLFLFFHENRILSLEPFDGAINIFNNKILCINNKKARLKIGDYIFAEDKSNLYTMKIKNLQIDNKNIKSVITPNQKIGIELISEKNLKKEWKYYYLAQ